MNGGHIFSLFCIELAACFFTTLEAIQEPLSRMLALRDLNYFNFILCAQVFRGVCV